MSRAIDRSLTQIVHDAAQSLTNGLRHFYPARNKNGFNEANLSYHLAKVFEKRPGACAFFEIPLWNNTRAKFNQRIDCLVFDRHIAVFVECKRLYSNQKSSEIAADFKRLTWQATRQILDDMTDKPDIDRSVYRLVLMETWQQSVVNWWQGEASRLKWDCSWHPVTRGSVLIRNFDSDVSLYWLYGFERISPA